MKHKNCSYLWIDIEKAYFKRWKLVKYIHEDVGYFITGGIYVAPFAESILTQFLAKVTSLSIQLGKFSLFMFAQF